MKTVDLGIPCALLGLLWASATFAAGPGASERGTFNVLFENDTFAGTDRNYTNGVELSWLSAPNRAIAPLDWIGRHVLRAGEDDEVYGGIGAGQSIYTPHDTKTTALLRDQHPYAGWLHMTLSSIVDTGRTLDTLALDLGLVGPDAGGEWVQNNVHDLLGAEEAKGWQHQVQNEPGFMLTADRKWRAIAEWRRGGLGVDVLPSVGLSIGNVLTQAQAGLVMRLGEELADDYGPPRIRPSLAGGGFFAPREKFSWYLFAGASGRAVAYNIVLDGNAFRDGGPSVNRRPLVAEAQAGLVMQLGRVQGAFTVVTRTDEFKGQDQQELFGALALSIKL
ncbi:MAG TPA: lipid A deacylase LpxR family protein [Gammaproteobacteria bacterium]|nr:lipid A deacylase LpxR family protein [Gammaproteobacteria bacterium]